MHQGDSEVEVRSCDQPTLIEGEDVAVDGVPGGHLSGRICRELHPDPLQLIADGHQDDNQQGEVITPDRCEVENVDPETVEEVDDCEEGDDPERPCIGHHTVDARYEQSDVYDAPDAEERSGRGHNKSEFVRDLARLGPEDPRDHQHDGYRGQRSQANVEGTVPLNTKSLHSWKSCHLLIQ